jgi:hypothetical protein
MTPVVAPSAGTRTGLPARPAKDFLQEPWKRAHTAITRRGQTLNAWPLPPAVLLGVTLKVPQGPGGAP